MSQDRGAWRNPLYSKRNPLPEGYRPGDVVHRAGAFWQSGVDNNLSMPGVDTNWSRVDMALVNDDDSAPTLLVQAAPAQTHRQVEFRDSTGALQSDVNNAGSFVVFASDGSTTAGYLATQDAGAASVRALFKAIADATVPLQLVGNTTQTADILQALNGASVVAKVGPKGALTLTPVTGAATPNLGLTIPDAASVGLRLKAAASQSGDFVQHQDSTGAVRARVTPTGSARFGANATYPDGMFIGDIGANDFSGVAHNAVANSTGYALAQNSAGRTVLNAATGQPIDLMVNNVGRGRLSSAGQLKIGATTDATSMLDVVVSGASVIGRITKAAASQSADMDEWQDSTGAVMTKVASDGTVSVGGQALVKTNDTRLATHGCRVNNSAAITLTTSTSTALTFDTERWDTDGFHDTTTNTSRLTVPAGLAGKYLIVGNASFAANATGSRELAIELNGTTYIADVLLPATSGSGARFVVSTVYDLAVGDYVRLIAFQSSGGNLNVQATTSYSPEFSMIRIGP